MAFNIELDLIDEAAVRPGGKVYVKTQKYTKVGKRLYWVDMARKIKRNLLIFK